MTQRAKNIRAAIRGREQDDAADLATTASRYITDRNRDAVDAILDEDVAAFAHSALLAGDALEIVGDCGPCLDRAQRRAWAAGRLLSVLQMIRHAYRLLSEREATAKRIAKLESKVEEWSVSAKAAWRASGMDSVVPFRDPTHSHVRHDWGD